LDGLPLGGAALRVSSGASQVRAGELLERAILLYAIGSLTWEVMEGRWRESQELMARCGKPRRDPRGWSAGAGGDRQGRVAELRRHCEELCRTTQALIGWANALTSARKLTLHLARQAQRRLDGPTEVRELGLSGAPQRDAERQAEPPVRFLAHLSDGRVIRLEARDWTAARAQLDQRYGVLPLFFERDRSTVPETRPPAT
jgi:hypothetical protein